MVKMFDFMSDNCKNCYKCIRYCPVKAIRFESGKAEIDSDKCIACGQCFVICPKHVRNVDNDLDATYKLLAQPIIKLREMYEALNDDNR